MPPRWRGPRRVRPWRPRITPRVYAGAAPVPTQIPYAWLSTPAQWRPDKPITSYQVAQDRGGTSSGADPGSQDEYGDNPLTVTLHTALAQDLANLGEFTLDFYATQPDEVPRQRFAVLALALNSRSLAEQLTIMNLERGDRISITGAPTTWPAGMTEQVIEGIGHVIDPNTRMVTLMTSPVVGSSPGVSGPWFRLGTSSWGGNDYIAW